MQPVGRTFHKMMPGQAFVEVAEHYHVELADGGYYLEYRKPYRDWPLIGMHALIIGCFVIGVIAAAVGIFAAVATYPIV
jgi:hypothetical protein